MATISRMFPVGPGVIELVTRTAMYRGTEVGCPALVPETAVQLPPQFGGLGLVLLANPLKLPGALPPLRVLADAHWAPQKVTVLPTTALPSPMTKAPFPAPVKTLAVMLALAEAGTKKLSPGKLAVTVPGPIGWITPLMAHFAVPSLPVEPVHVCAVDPLPRVNRTARPWMAVEPSSCSFADSDTVPPSGIAVGPVYVNVVCSGLTVNCAEVLLDW